MSRFTKIAVTIPTPIYEAVERVRRRSDTSRSAAVALALEAWLHRQEAGEADRRYMEAYLRQPEQVDQLGAVATQATSHWDRWKPGEPSRAADGIDTLGTRSGSRRLGRRIGRAPASSRGRPR